MAVTLMSPVLLAGSLLLLLSGIGHSVVVEQAVEDRAIGLVEELITNLTAQQGPGRIGNPTAKMIRLIFHDCVASGCDGCVEVDNPENFGLEGISRELSALYDNELSESGMSRADFYALAAVVAVRVAADEQSCMMLMLPPDCTKPVPDMSIVYGRKDCATSPNSNGDTGFPDAHGDLEHVLEVFRDGMGLTVRQVVALIGAHTMGMATPRNSGFQGPWAPPTTRFDNAFFRTLVSNNSAWHQSRLNFRDAPDGVNPRFQWDLGSIQRMQGGPPPMGVRMMLNTDMALFKRVTPDETGRETVDSCRDLFTDCEPSSTAAITLEYARNNTRWHEDFGPAFQILLEHGYPDNHLVAAGQTLPVLVDPTLAPVVGQTTGDSEEPTTDGDTDSAVGTKAAALVLAMCLLISTLV